MKAKDLMIGDWVREKGSKLPPLRYTGEIFHFKPIEGEPYIRLRCMWNKTDGLDISETYIEPIPLTPEILEKNGFKIDKNETYCKRYFFACNLDKVPQTVVEFSFYGEGVSADTLFKCWTKPESCDGENSIHICDLKSVHELQHALRLCGIEHEITL